MSVELPQAYKEALAGLQGQARAATAMLDDPKAGRQALRDAQTTMRQHPQEAQHIIRLVSAADTTVPDLTEARLIELLANIPAPACSAVKR